ncbi:MAG: glycosyltransferase family 4 protein [Ignavibacteria bacterium]
MDRKRKVVMVGSIPPPYHGSNVYFYNLINSRISEEFKISHLDISDHRSLDNLSKLDLTNVRLALKNLFDLFQLVRKLNPEIVYIPVSSNFLPYLRDGGFILIASYFSKAKIIIHLHEGDFFRKIFYSKSNFAVRYYIRHTLSKVKTAIVYSETLKDNFIGFIRNIVAFPNGLKSEKIIEKKSCRDNDANINITFYSNLFESKGVLDVLNAAAIVIKDFKKVTFKFTGEWNAREEPTRIKAAEIIIDNKMHDFIKFTGIISGTEKEKLLQNTDVMVFPTWYPYEGCPMVIIEAMSYGCPVISTKNVGAIPEMVIDGITGSLVDKKNPKQIAEALIRLIKDKNLREKMGDAGRKRFEEHFTLNKNIDNIINTFTKALN